MTGDRSRFITYVDIESQIHNMFGDAIGLGITSSHRIVLRDRHGDILGRISFGSPEEALKYLEQVEGRATDSVYSRRLDKTLPDNVRIGSHVFDFVGPNIQDTALDMIREGEKY